MEFTVRAIATVRASRRTPDDDYWDSESAVLELAHDVPDEALRGLEQFSHVEVLFVAHQANDVPPAPWVRRPRGNSQWPEVGIFAQRNKDRPNRILVSVAKIVSMTSRSLTVQGLDALDDTPVLDIKPVFTWNAPRGSVVTPAWVEELGEHYYS